MRDLVHRARRFLTENTGSVSVEAIIILPILTTLYVASFVWFDAYRAENTNIKAAYTIADIISRQDEPIDQDYVDGLLVVFDYLTRSRQPTRLRVTIVECDSNCDQDEGRVLRVAESFTTDGWSKQTNGSINLVAAGIPLMAADLENGASSDMLILVETLMTYEPAFRAGLGGPQDFINFVPIAPRAPQVNY